VLVHKNRREQRNAQLQFAMSWVGWELCLDKTECRGAVRNQDGAQDGGKGTRNVSGAACACTLPNSPNATAAQGLRPLWLVAGR
jgi:hypothetical protein